MRVFKINYEIQGDKNFTAGILAENKDKALKFLKKTVGNIKRISGIGSNDTDVHGIDDEIIQRILKKYDKVEVVKEETGVNKDKELQNKIKLLESEKEIQLKEKDKHINKLNNDINNLTSELESLRMEGVKETTFVCNICNAEFKSKVGMKNHRTRVHKND